MPSVSLHTSTVPTRPISRRRPCPRLASIRSRTVQAMSIPEARAVNFRNQQGQKLAGILTTARQPIADPSTNAKPKCVILCHGYTDHKNGFHLPALAAALADVGEDLHTHLTPVDAQHFLLEQQLSCLLLPLLLSTDFNSLRFDFNGNGDSEGTFRLAGYLAEVADIAAAKEYLEQEEGQQVVGLLGKHGWVDWWVGRAVGFWGSRGRQTQQEQSASAELPLLTGCRSVSRRSSFMCSSSRSVSS